MAESTLKTDNVFIPKYVPNNLKWYKRGSLDTWYLQNKCNEFLEDTDLHLKQRQIVNFDIIKNGVSERTIKQYNQIHHDEIKKYPAKHQDQILSSIIFSAIINTHIILVSNSSYPVYLRIFLRVFFIYFFFLYVHLHFYFVISVRY